MHWETKTLVARFIAVVWNQARGVSQVCLYM